MKPTNFTYLNNGAYQLESFGFKIHISATLGNYNQIFNLVYPFLIKENSCFKYLNSREIIEFNFSDREMPAESGKFLTIYPQNKEHCLKLLDQLYSLLPSDAEGIYILSDRPYKDSQVIFYRYGCIELDESSLEDGIPTLYGPNGEKWQDYQKTYFDLPTWIEDLQEPMPIEDSYLSQHYQVESVLKQSNGGNVYLARSKQTAQQVVIKESKPHITCIGEVNRETLRLNEWTLSQHFTASIPKPIETVQEWINQYYIYEYIPGTDLCSYCDKHNLFAYASDTSTINYQKYEKLMSCFKSILEKVLSLHRQGLVLNDIHPDNFIVGNDGQVTFIDLENSYKYGTDPIVGIYNEISLREWNKLDGYVSDCHKIGKLMLYLLGRLHHKNINLKQLLLQRGISSNLEDIINDLLSPSANLEHIVERFKAISLIQYSKPIYRITCPTNFNSSDRLNLIELAFFKNPNIHEAYESLLTDEAALLERLKKEKRLGLDGLAGLILYLQRQKDSREVSNRAVNYLLNHLASVGGLKGVKIGDASVSPYLGDGTAGIILTLLELGEIDLAEELAPILLTEFAQFTGIWNGMLGIAYTLLRLVEETKEKSYLEKARELIISCLAIDQDSIKHRQECLYLSSYYTSVEKRYL